MVASTPDRERLMAVQTPQGLELSVLRRGFELARQENLTVTDDAGLAEALGLPVHVVAGSEENVKITTPEDLRLLGGQSQRVAIPRVGFGYDVHRYVTKNTPPGYARAAHGAGIALPYPARPRSSPIPTGTCSCTPWPTPCSAVSARATSASIFRTRTSGSRAWPVPFW